MVTSTKRSIVLLALVLVLALPTLAFSQQLSPISGAKVVALGDNGSGEATTDASGYFRIEEGIGAGTYTVTVSASGYISKVITNVQVLKGEEKDLDDIELEPSAVIEGVVKTPDGKPAVRVPVVAINAQGEVISSTIAESDGSFRLDTDIKTGTYIVRAYAFTFEGFEYKTIQLGFAQIKILVPKQRRVYLEGYARGEVSVRAEQGKTVRVKITLEPSGIISGTVKDEQGNPVEGVVVIAFPPEKPDRSMGSLE